MGTAIELILHIFIKYNCNVRLDVISLNITNYFVNRGSSKEGELRMRVLSRKRKLSASILAFVVAAVMVFGLWPQSAGAAENAVADDLTVNKWHDSNALDDSTKNVGRIWTDKSVSTEDVTLTKPGQTETKTIQKNGDSDFLVGLSALSSTAKIMGQTTVPLDIVLVLDVSGSMDDQGKMTTLKTAVNSFIDTTAAENDKRSDTNK